MAIAPEGTRKKVDHWKTGFYYIAMEAGGTQYYLFILTILQKKYLF